MQKIFATFLMVFLAIAISGQAVAQTPQPTQDDYDDLREIVSAKLEDYRGTVEGFVGGMLDEQVEGLIQDAIKGLLDPNNLTNLTGPILGDLIGNAINDALGDAFPGSVDVGSVIDEILGNDEINALIVRVLEDKYFGLFIDKTIENIFAELEPEFFVGAMLEVILGDLTDELTNEIWKDGNPSSSAIFGLQLGHWKTTGGWNDSAIGVTVMAKMVSGGWEGISEGNINIQSILSLFDINLVFDAAKDALEEVVDEFRSDFRAKIRERIQDRVEEFKAEAKARFIDDLNEFLAKTGLNVELTYDMSLSDIEDKIKYAIAEMKAELRVEKKAEFQAKLAEFEAKLKALKLNVISAFKDFHDCIDRIIQCIQDKKDDDEPEYPEEPVYVGADASAFVTKLNGNQNELTITVMEVFSDGSKIDIVETFVINNNAADTYLVGGYYVYVDTKGNTQVRECDIVGTVEEE